MVNGQEGFISQAKATKGKRLVSVGGRLVVKGSAAEVVLRARQESKATGETETQAQRRIAERATGGSPGSSITIQVSGKETPIQRQLAAKRAGALSAGVDIEGTEKQVTRAAIRERAGRGETQLDIKETPELPQERKQQVTRGFKERTGFEEEVFRTTIKEGARTATLFEAESFAKTEPSELSFFKRLDVALGGRLPGGVSPEFAKAIRRKEFLLADEKKTKQLTRRGQILTGAGIAAGGAAFIAAAPAIAPAVSATGAALFTKAGIVTTAAAVTTIPIGGVGVLKATEKIGESKATRTQKEILSTTKGRSQISRAIEAGRTRASREGARISDPNLIKRISQSIATGGTRERLFEFGARESLRKEGLVGGKLEEAVSLTKQKRTATRLGEIGGFVALSAGSELFGRTAVKAVTLKSATRLSKRKILKEATKAITVAGIGEGVATDVLLTTSGTLPVNPLRTVGLGIGGGISAGAIGRQVVKQSLKSPARGRVTLGAAFLADPGEPFGDFLADVAQKSLKGVAKGARGIRTRVSTITPAFTFTKTPTRTTNIIKSVTKTPTRTITSPVSIPTTVKIPTTVPSTPVVPTITNIPTIVPTPTPTIVTTPTTVPSTPVVPTVTTIPTIVPTPTPVPATTTIPVAVPAIKLPAFIPGIPGGGGPRGGFFRGKKKKKITKFLPSIGGILAGGKAKIPDVLTGLEVRKIPIKF